VLVPAERFRLRYRFPVTSPALAGKAP